MANMINEDIARLNGLADRIALLASGSLTDAQARALMKGLIGEIKRAYSNLRYYMEQGSYGQTHHTGKNGRDGRVEFWSRACKSGNGKSGRTSRAGASEACFAKIL